MPTTRYINENLTFLPSQQGTWQPQFSPGIHTIFPPGTANSQASSSSESECSAPETFHESSNSPLRSPDTTTAVGEPFLQFVEPPVESCRFRYPTEMKGTHGSILGISTQKKGNKGKTFPTIKLNNFSSPTVDEKVIIRCTLTTAEVNERDRIPHVHQLKGKGQTTGNPLKTVEIDDPIDIVVSALNNYQATFGNMTILYIKKDDQLDELVKKKKRHIRKKFTNPNQNQATVFANTDEKQLLAEAQMEIQMMNLNRLNTACLKFEALRGGSGRLLYEPICPPIYSHPINNTKNPQFNDLRICRIDKVAGNCLGKEEVFIFVEKVNKKDIKVRFFELDDYQKEIWHAYAEMGEDDVHYQFAIAFRTPRYKNVEITDNVKVYFQLERPSNGSKSAPRGFEYTPDPNRWRDEVRKRPRRESPPIPVTVSDLSRPSTSASTAPSVRPSIANVFSPTVPSPSAFAGGSNSSSSMAVDENSWSELSELFENFPPMELDIGNIGDADLDIPEAGTASLPLSNASSLDALLSSFPSGDSERIKQMINNNAAMNLWASCNGTPDNVIQQIRSEVGDTYTLDGAPTVHAKFQMDYAEHQSGLVCGTPEMIGTSEVEYARIDNNEPVKKPTIVYEGLGNRLRLYNRNRNKLTRENIVSNVDKVLSGLLKIKKCGKITEQCMKDCLLGIFATRVGEDDDSVLHVLAANEHFPSEMMRFLNVLKMYNIAATVVDLRNDLGQSALHIAAEKGSLQTISLLTEIGVDINARDQKLNTPIHVVANRAHDAFHAVGHLLEKDPDLFIFNTDGLTALHLFVIKRKSDIISSLIIKHENQFLPVDLINIPDRKQGNTALHFAVQKRFKEIVNLLLNFDDRIDVNAKNFEDKTPLAYVSGEKDQDALEIEERLLASNADPALVLARRNKTTKELEELKDEFEINNDNIQDEVEVDESLPSYAQDWKSDAELRLMDAQTVCSVCPVLDDNKNWEKLLKKLDFVEDIQRNLAVKWSPTLYLLKAVVETMPYVTPEHLRDTLMKINPECKKAAQFIDDMILCNMGVF